MGPGLLWARAAACVALIGAPLARGANPVGNPFLDHTFHVNVVNKEQFDQSIATAAGEIKANLQRMQSVPAAFWIDKKAKLKEGSTFYVERVLQGAASKPKPELVVLVWYNLPNRDCHAKASDGEICCYKNDNGTCNYDFFGDCVEGLQEYKSEFVDPFMSILKRYDGKVPMVVLVEPDSLVNLAVSQNNPHCGNPSTQAAYMEGVKHVLDRLTTELKSVTVYLDAAHGGWLGWEANLEKFMRILRAMEMPMTKVRGFSTNVGNYQPLGVQCPHCPDEGFRNSYCLAGRHASDPCCEDPCGLLEGWNSGNNELNYAVSLTKAAKQVLKMDAHVVIDTSRNGVSAMRDSCSNWCNPRGARAGVASTARVANASLVDAYFWVKTPGESDGCSRTQADGSICPRFDEKCASSDSIGTGHGEPPAPEAGTWFDYQVKQLATDAVLEPQDPPPAISDSKCEEGAGDDGTPGKTGRFETLRTQQIHPVVGGAMPVGICGLAALTGAGYWLRGRPGSAGVRSEPLILHGGAE